MEIQIRYSAEILEKYVIVRKFMKIAGYICKLQLILNYEVRLISRNSIILFWSYFPIQYHVKFTCSEQYLKILGVIEWLKILPIVFLIFLDELGLRIHTINNYFFAIGLFIHPSSLQKILLFLHLETSSIDE